MENLKGEAAPAAGKLVPEAIRKPEELNAALLEAERKYQSAQALGQNLVEAYQATLKAVEGHPKPGATSPP